MSYSNMERQCAKCGTVYPLTREYFGQYNNQGRIGFRGTCRKCMARVTARHSAANPDMVYRRAVQRRARISRAGGQLGERERHQIARHQSFNCYYCGVFDQLGEVDHLTPISRGGSNDRRNLVWACCQCNREKHNKTEDEYREWRFERNMSVNF